LNQGCSVISFTGIRCLGSILRSFEIKSFAMPEKTLGQLIFNAKIFAKRSL